MSTDKTRDESTSCYTYEVSLVVQVVASNRDEADEKLDREGGYVSYRSVNLKDTITVHTAAEATEEE